MAVADLIRFQELLGNPEIKSVLVLLPHNPSLDIVASGLSLVMILEKKGYATTISAPSPITVEFNRLIGVNKIRQEMGDNNLLLSFAGYPAENIEKVSYNIENGQFFLTVMPKPGNKAPGQEHISVSYTGVVADTVMVIGVNYPDDLGHFAENKELVDVLGRNLVLCGNVPLAGWPKAIEMIDASGITNSEVVWQVAQALGVPLDEDLATNLFLGLESGTNNFTSSTVRAETFALASELLRAGARRGNPVVPLVPQAPQYGSAVGRQTTPEDLARFRDSTNIG